MEIGERGIKRKDNLERGSALRRAEKTSLEVALSLSIDSVVHVLS